MLDIRSIHISAEIMGCIFCLVCCIYIMVGQSLQSRRWRIMISMLLLEATQLFSDAMAYIYRGNLTMVGYYGARISNFLVFFINYVIAIVILIYVEYFLRNREKTIKKIWKYMIYGTCGLGMLLVIASQFTGYLYSFDEQNCYFRGPGYHVISLVAGLILLEMLTFVLYYIRYLKPLEYIPLLVIFVSEIIADGIQMVYYGISFTNLSMLGGIVLMFLFYEMERSKQLAAQANQILEDELRIAKHEAELSEKRSQIMLSQIQPHFLYNALGTIEYLCGYDAKLAQSTIHQFSKYLRMNMSSVQNRGIVSFEKEMDFTRTYLSIEKIRFEEDLEIIYDFDFTEFMIPPLTLQPLVENAVSHGIGGDPDGGTIHISSRKEGDMAVIVIEDDGAGFDVEAYLKEKENYIGIENVKTRLEEMCQGSLMIESEVGVGTKVTIRIPLQ